MYKNTHRSIIFFPKTHVQKKFGKQIVLIARGGGGVTMFENVPI